MAEEKKPEEKKEVKAVDNLVTSKHSIKIGGKTIKYTMS